jgi:hypothetical protein
MGRSYSESVAFLSNMRREQGGEPVRVTSKNLEAVLNALRQAGVEIKDDGLRLLKRRR